MTKQNNTTKTIIIVICVAVLLAGLWLGTSYNRLITLQTAVEENWANIETQYQRRIDLIPNLVTTVKAFAQHEQTLFTQLAQLRSQWQTAQSIDAKIATAQSIDGALGRLIAVAENYPQLRSSENFLSLQDELAGTENRIAVARTRYNEAIKYYNTAVRRFPTNIIAGLFNFGEKQSFAAVSGAERAPTVTF